MTILANTKEYMGTPTEETIFDLEILTQINSAIATLKELGLTYFDTIYVESSTEWPIITDLPLRGFTEAYVYQKVKSVFDPTANTTVAGSLANSLNETEQRLLYRLEELTAQEENNE